MHNKNPLLLIVDDFEGVQRPYRYLLSLEGFRVDFAINGQEALDKALELQPDVIFMDLSLPGIDGWEATRRLKADERTQKIPVIMLSALGLEPESGAIAGAGFDGYSLSLAHLKQSSPRYFGFYSTALFESGPRSSPDRGIHAQTMSSQEPLTRGSSPSSPKNHR